MNGRVEEEFQLLHQRFPTAECNGLWFRINTYPLTPGLWGIDQVSIAFSIPDSYPGQKPYAFYVSPPLQLPGGALPGSSGAASEPPFPGTWQKFSWDQPEWAATSNVHGGSNLLTWALSFRDRLDDHT
jgi:hypothetical protein